MDLEKIKPKVEVIAHRSGADLIVLFGSRADGTNRPNSDVDLAYSRVERLPLDQELKLGLDLASLFGTENYDITYLSHASAIFLYEITKKAVPLFAKDRLKLPTLSAYAVKRMHENMRLYQTMFEKLCEEYQIK